MNKKKILLSASTLLVLFLAVALLFLFRGGFLESKIMSFSASKIKENENAQIIKSENISNDQSAENKEIIDEDLEVEKEKNSEVESSKERGDNPLNITSRFVYWGYEKASTRKIDAIIIHSSYNALGGDPYSLEKLLAEYRKYSVAPHYLIDREGKIYQLVAEKNIAYHAGESATPDGRTNVNDFSIGIEMMNKEDSKFTGDQYAALNDLLRYLRSKYKIKYVLGHNQIAPGRKSDPWNFEWGRIDE